MFNGIIEQLGKIKEKENRRHKQSVTIECKLKDLKIGESIAVDGTCLTVARKKKKGSATLFTSDLSEETLRKTTLGHLKPGNVVNLERALRLSDRISGHFVQGHVDGVGNILRIKPEDTSKLYTFSYPAALAPYLITKGSVAVNGISLTIVDVYPGSFSVAIIPFTEAETCLHARAIGDPVNLEADVLAKILVKQARAFLMEREKLDLFERKEFTWSDVEEIL